MMAIRQNPAPTFGTVRTLLLMGAVFFIASILVTAVTRLVSGLPPSEIPTRLAPWAILWGLSVLLFVPGVLLAERASGPRGRAVPYAVLVLVGSALVASLAVPLFDWLGIAGRLPLPRGSPFPSFPRQLMAFCHVVVRMGLAAFIYADHREQLAAAQAAQVLESRRNEMMGRLAASRLKAAHARVKPEAFVAELRAIRATYLEDPAVAGAGLETLILRLRAASRSAVP